MKYLITLLLLFISISSKAQIPEDIPKVYIPPFYDVWWVHLYDYKVCEYNYPDSRLVDKKKSPTTNVCYNCRNIYNSLKQKEKEKKAMNYADAETILTEMLEKDSLIFSKREAIKVALQAIKDMRLIAE